MCKFSSTLDEHWKLWKKEVNFRVQPLGKVEKEKFISAFKKFTKEIFGTSKAIKKANFIYGKHLFFDVGEKIRVLIK